MGGVFYSGSTYIGALFGIHYMHDENKPLEEEPKKTFIKRKSKVVDIVEVKDDPLEEDELFKDIMYLSRKR